MFSMILCLFCIFGQQQAVCAGHLFGAAVFCIFFPVLSGALYCFITLKTTNDQKPFRRDLLKHLKVICEHFKCSFCASLSFPHSFIKRAALYFSQRVSIQLMAHYLSCAFVPPCTDTLMCGYKQDRTPFWPTRKKALSALLVCLCLQVV